MLQSIHDSKCFCWVSSWVLTALVLGGDYRHVAFVEARLESLPKENVEAVQRLLYRACTGVKLGATAAPDGEEARALFLAWEKMGPLLAYTREDPELQAVVAMRDLLRELYTDTPPLNDLGASAVRAAVPCTVLKGRLPFQLAPLPGGGCDHGSG